MQEKQTDGDFGRVKPVLWINKREREKKVKNVASVAMKIYERKTLIL